MLVSFLSYFLLFFLCFMPNCKGCSFKLKVLNLAIQYTLVNTTNCLLHPNHVERNLLTCSLSVYEYTIPRNPHKPLFSHHYATP